MNTLQTCKAKSKQSGQKCKNYVTKGKAVCRFHGGKNSGAKTSKGKLLQKMGSWKHGLRSKEAIQEAKDFREFVKSCKDEISLYS